MQVQQTVSNNGNHHIMFMAYREDNHMSYITILLSLLCSLMTRMTVTTCTCILLSTTLHVRGCILSVSIVVNLCLAVAINVMEHSTEANTMLQIKIYEYVIEALV